jgi:4-hydroxybenzoate polyprenyltransferase
MIPISTFNLLLIVAVLFAIYAIIDHRNRLYANVIMSFMSGLLSAFLASAIATDTVYEIVAGVATPVNSPSIGYFLYFVCTVMFAYTIIMAYEIINEEFQKKTIAKESERERDG